MAKIIKIMAMFLVPLVFITTVGVTAQAKTQSTPKSIRGTWVNGIQYNEYTGKFKTCYYIQIKKHGLIATKWQTDAYNQKIVAVKKVRSSYRLKVQDLSMVPLKHPTYHYLYVMKFTINKKRCLSVASSYSGLGVSKTICGTVRDNGLSKYF